MPPPPSSFPARPFWVWCYVVLGSPFGQLGSAVLPVSFPSFLIVGAEGRAEKALTLCKHGSARTKSPLCFQPLSPQIQTRTLHKLL